MSTLRSSPSSWWKRGLAVISLHFKHQRFKHALIYGNGERAEAWAREALSFAEAHFPPDHRQVLQCRQNLANAQEKRENFAGAGRADPAYRGGEGTELRSNCKTCSTRVAQLRDAPIPHG